LPSLLRILFACTLVVVVFFVALILGWTYGLPPEWVASVVIVAMIVAVFATWTWILKDALQPTKLDGSENEARV
jgi:hypothetical protein